MQYRLHFKYPQFENVYQVRYSFGKPKKMEAQAVIGPRETAEGARYAKTLEDRLAGVGVGFGPEYVSKTTSPYAEARRYGFQTYETPQISQQASARGLGRSTIPVNMIARSGQEAERDIEERVAQMYAQSEAQKRAEINDALSKYGVFTGDVTAAENAKRKAASDAQNYNKQAYGEYETGLWKGGTALGLDLLSNLTGGMFPGSSSVFGGKSSSQSMGDIDALLEGIGGEKQNRAKVSIMGQSGKSGKSGGGYQQFASERGFDYA